MILNQRNTRNTNKDILQNLKQEREKMEEVQFNEEFEFSKDFSHLYNQGGNTSRDEDDHVELNNLSALD